MMKAFLLILFIALASCQTFQPMAVFISQTVCNGSQTCIDSQPAPNPDIQMTSSNNTIWINFNPSS